MPAYTIRSRERGVLHECVAHDALAAMRSFRAEEDESSVQSAARISDLLVAGPFREYSVLLLVNGYIIPATLFSNPSFVRPEDVQALERYVNAGQPAGSFLDAALSNDFKQVMALATSDQRDNLYALANFIYNNMPSSSQGSRETVTDWLAQFPLSEETKTEDAENIT